MAEHNAHINYTLADIERYLQGRMNAREMHDMEKAALQDPFLADAIEGYSDADNAVSEQHLNEITALLQQPKKNAKVVTMAGRRFQWLRAAAVVVVILGAAFISYSILNNNNASDENANLAQEKVKLPLEADTISAEDDAKKKATTTLLNDSLKEKAMPLAKDYRASDKSSPKKQKTETLSTQQLEYSPALPEKNQEPIAKAELNNGYVAKKQADDSFLATTKSLKDSLSVPASPVAGTLDEMKVKKQPVEQQLQGRVAGVQVNKSNRTNQGFANVQSNQSQLTNTFQGKILDNNNLPVANAFVRINNSNSNIGTVTDQKGNFKISFADSVLNITVSALNYQPETTTLKNNASASIVLNEVDNSLSEVVVTGFGTKRKDSNTHSDTLATPANGWDSFEEYVYKKLDKSYDSTANYADLKGDVELEFLVDRQGKPYNFKVLQSLNDSADNKAIEIVKEGPKWISGKKKKKGKVLIHF
ncbi:carboxypeptidase-like regulatory domain-containing protein [Foetidibacter luteolus]|uniref:carboxypeptidase-like regulatory domain-containing protein n=1 Tax=Foetidibacter luteolus TaxID=2608880 RepID=UPI001A99AE61|nr:carboxypeptidase-like regulatory domain-containing protein [Foetidibacter luteolus]